MDDLNFRFIMGAWHYYYKVKSLPLKSKTDLEVLFIDAYFGESGIDFNTAEEILGAARCDADPSSAIERMAAARTAKAQCSRELCCNMGQ
jgi:hypothetical protein